jgi:hypothetical protein
MQTKVFDDEVAVLHSAAIVRPRAKSACCVLSTVDILQRVHSELDEGRAGSESLGPERLERFGQDER